ncbi:MAG: RusA family crossover junction endodeoxyribonuclease [Spirochaetes bacterium]|uniref:RusA family crossover junction endodeoxyribonuclease n=1 Tax=Candidatus Aphodenecus pullistercoris TaxID=2840669 RepID=A0A9D9E717_9SPIR|nr:RusA family crossover junction endodeoxyribonuclease [Candidatus Aphodenecus pullistercoris]
MKISFEVDGEVMGMPRPRSTIVNGHVRVYETKESSENKAYIRMAYRDALQKAMPEVTTAARDELGYAVTIVIRKACPKSFSKKKRKAALAGELRPTTKPDLDNVAKTILDALNGVAWKDDSEITTLAITKRYSELSSASVLISWNDRRDDT